MVCKCVQFLEVFTLFCILDRLHFLFGFRYQFVQHDGFIAITVDSFAVLFKKIIERNGDFQHLQLFDFLFVFSYFGGDLKLYFCSIGAVGGRLLFLKIPMLQRNGYAQSYELTAAVMGKNKSKRG